MPLFNTDRFVVQRGNTLYKVDSSILKTEYSSEATVTISENPPLNPVQGSLWWSTREGNLFIWYDETVVGGDSSQWVDASPAFVDIDYSRIFDYIDNSVLENSVSQIQVTDEITVSPESGQGVVTIGVDLSAVENEISNLNDADELLQDNIDLKVDIIDFETDQQRQDDFLAEDQQRQDDRIAELESIVRDLSDRLDQLEDTVAGLATIDGGYPNAEGVFDEDDIDGGNANPASQTPPDIGGGNAEGYD